MDFHATGINVFLIGKNVLIIMVPILINKDVFEPNYNDSKFTVWNHNYLCTNLISRIIKDYYIQLHTSEKYNLEEMDKFLESITFQSQVMKLKLHLKIFQQTEVQDQMASQVNSIKYLGKS